MRSLKILTWNTRASYLYYLTQAPHEFYVLTRPGRPPGYAGRSSSLPWGKNVHEVPVSEARYCQFDCILFQSDQQYREDQFEFLTPSQRALPRIFIEHDPPTSHPTDTSHPVDDADMLLVHVTPFNALMWNSGRTPTHVIEHGVTIPDGFNYLGDRDSGLVIANDLARRGRSLGADVFNDVRAKVRLDLVGTGSEQLGGQGPIPHSLLPAFAARYRFLFSPSRYTSVGLAVIEAMMIGMPIVSFATTEMATVIDNGHSGFISNDPCVLVDHMQELARNPALARSLGQQAQRTARERFNIDRFCSEWDGALRHVTGTRRHSFGIGGI